MNINDSAFARALVESYLDLDGEAQRREDEG
jgi:hypothetical protein